MRNLGKGIALVASVCAGTGGTGRLRQAGGRLPFRSWRGFYGASPSPAWEEFPLGWRQQPRQGTGQNACAGALLPLGGARQEVDSPRGGAALLRGQPAGVPAGAAALELARDDQDGKAGLEIQK